MPRRTTTTNAQQRSLTLRDALATLPEDQRQVARPAPPRRPHARRDRRPPRPHRAVDPRPAPPRPRRPARRADRDGVRARPSLEGGGVTATDSTRPTAAASRSPASTRPTPSCSRSCSRSSRASRGRARSRWAPSSRPSRPSSPPTARPTTRSASRSGTEAHLARAARARHRPRRRGDRPDELVHRDGRGRQLGRRDAASSSTSTPRRTCSTAEHVEAAISPRTRCVIPVHLMGSTVDLDPILEVARAARPRA